MFRRNWIFRHSYIINCSIINPYWENWITSTMTIWSEHICISRDCRYADTALCGNQIRSTVVFMCSFHLILCFFHLVMRSLNSLMRSFHSVMHSFHLVMRSFHSIMCSFHLIMCSFHLVMNSSRSAMNVFHFITWCYIMFHSYIIWCWNKYRSGFI